ncbi:TonB-dependent siderophore receptor [Herbaspirillum autotrophicum]|uniref:TonB-dependent siderophore receptor n=1 Tax=Herbaspirillum autotrophicum TaxID=180195 RepID=UPI00067DB0BB|nr:TonB-dependent siderophore receptor [Herbaspirillum autotrophicum]
MKRFSPLAMTLTLAAALPEAYAAGNNEETPAGDALPTISVSAARDSKDAYRARAASVAGFDEAALLDTPASVTVVTAATLQDQQARLLTDVIKNDPGISENYAPVGYYENISIRGFPLDLASGYRINGMTISGEQNVALENKESVEFLKGLAGLQGGVATPGGLVNYVTKRPADVRSVMVGADANGSRYLATDIGTLFGAQQQFGLRINAAHEDINSYVDHADGYRDFASVAASWIISPRARLQINAEYQQKVQRSVSAYQLLGGTTVPSNVSPTVMLSPQPWAKPVAINSLNMDVRLDLDLAPDWRAYVAASRSRAVIDDNVAFVYGSGISPYFSANGDFDVYDYRSPNDERRNDQLQTVVLGKFDTGAVRHDLTMGASLFRRTVDQTDAVFDYRGSDNIYNPTPLIFSPSPQQPGLSYRRLDSRQQSLFATDRMHFGERWQVIAGGRQIWLKEQAFDATGAVTRDTDRSLFLPQLALIYQPNKSLSFYTSYTEALSLGGQAPAWAGGLILPPVVSRQVEAGIKYDWKEDVSLTAALFRMNKPYEYPKPNADGSFTYLQQGTQTNTGLELGASGKFGRQWRLSAGLAWTQARVRDTGTPAYDGHQAINVPRLRTALHADYAVPGMDDLHLLGSWLYSGNRAANRDGTATVSAWNIFNAGLRYGTRIGGHATTIRFTVDNLFDKRYWKDVGESLGDSYLHLGAPRLARLTMQYDF